MSGFVFRQADYPPNPAPGSRGIWPARGFIRAFEAELDSARTEALASLEKCWWGNEEPIAYILARCVRSPRAAFVAWLLNRP